MTDEHVTNEIRSWIGQARWFGGKGRNWTLTSMRRVGELPDAPDGLRVAIQLAELTYDDGSSAAATRCSRAGPRR